MKIQTKNLLKSIVSLALCLSMVLCTPLMAFAAEIDEQTNEKQTIVYVSLGDSMTNGYCLEGYDGTSGAVNYGIETYSNKFAAYLAGYEGDIKDDQVIFEGKDRIVDHRQLAISGLRAQDIQWILELKYTNDTLIQNVFNFDYNGNDFNETTWYDTWGFNADRYTWSELCDYDYRYADAAARILSVYHGGNGTGYFTSSYASETAITNAINGIKANPYYPAGKNQTNEIGGYKYLQIATEFYQESVKDADIISLAVGNTNFGTHMLSNIVDVIMSSDDKPDLSFSKDYNTAKLREKINSNDNKDYVNEKINVILNSDNYQTMLDMCKSLAYDNDGNKTAVENVKAEEIGKIVEYCMIAYINGYIGMLDAILKVNPDVEIIQIPLMNAYESEGGVIEPDTLGELAEIIYTPVNDLLENLLPDYIEKYEDAKFYLSKDVYVSCMVEVFGDDFYFIDEDDDEVKDDNENFVTYPGPLNGTEGYTANKNSVVRDRFVEEIACGSLIFASMDLLPSDPENPTPKMQKKNYSTNVKNFLYGGEVEGVDGYKYNGIGAANYDLLTDTQKAAYAAENPLAAKEYALYLAFEYSIILSGTENVTMDALANLSNIQTIFMDCYADILGKINAAVPNYFEAAAPVVAAGSDGQLSTTDVITIMNAYQTGGDDGAVMAAYGIAAEKANAMISNLMGSDSSISITLTGADMYTLYNAPDFSAAVCDLIAEKSGGQLTSAQVGTLVASEDGVFTVAAQFVNKPYITAELIKSMYADGGLDEEQTAQIELLFKVREGALAFIRYETYLKTSVETLLTSLPTIIESTSTLAYLLAVPNSMGNALFEDRNLQGALCMNARCLLGTGAGGHPSTIGHDSIYNAMLGTFNQDIKYVWSDDYSTCTASRGEYATETVESTSAVTTPATCMNTGKVSYTAVFETYWAATQTKEVVTPVIPHDYEAVVTEPTCYAKGYTTYTCKVEECKHTYTDNETEVIPHDYAATVTDPTCEEKGFTTYVCKVEECKHTYTGDEVPETGHDYEAVVTDPTCTEGGYTTYTCKNDSTHTYIDDITEKLGHSYGEDGRCTRLLPDGTVCGVYNLEQFGQCLPTVNAELTSGSTVTMLLDGTNLGEFTFTETDSGWTIANANGKYLASDANGNFVLSDSAYNWTYSNGKFSTTVKVPGTTWYEQLFGITKDVTYYLAVSDGSVTVNATGSSVAFTTTANNGYHTFNGVTVIEPNCTEEGHTERVCTVCGETFKTDVTPSLGHNHVPTVHAPLCGIKGYTEYTCSVCGDSYTGDEVPALEHDFNDNDECNNCHKSQLELSGGCSEKVESSVSNGEYILSLGGTEVGTYTFASVNGGWSIKDANGKYLSVDSNGNLVLSDNAFAWTYSNGKFSATVGKASTNWIEALLGMNKKSTTYYLVASGSSVATSTTGADAKFYTEVSNATHTFNKIDHAASCGVDAYSEYVCDVCGYTFVKEFDGTALQHSYSVTETVEVSCTANGYTKYTCSNCGDSYVTDVVTSSGHNFVDGFCTVCGEPEEPDCVYVTEQTLTSGKTYELSLGGNSVGEYTFTSVSGGWNIMNSEGKYLAVEGGKLVVSDSPFAWTYSNGRFSSSSSAGTGISWLDMILGSKKSTYYLASSGNNVTVSTSTSAAAAKFTAEVTGEHNYSGAKPVDGNHVYTCHNCGYNKIEICNDDNCAICNASVNVSVNIEETTSGNWIDLLLGKGKKTNKVTITTVASGTEVTSVEYSLNGTTWTKGTVFTSKTAVTNFNIRVQAANGITYNYLYNNGSVSAI